MPMDDQPPLSCDHPRQFCLCCSEVIARTCRNGLASEMLLRAIDEAMEKGVLQIDHQRATQHPDLARRVTPMALATFFQTLRSPGRLEALEQVLVEAAMQLGVMVIPPAVARRDSAALLAADAPLPDEHDYPPPNDEDVPPDLEDNIPPPEED